MKFYDRKRELQILQQIRQKAESHAQFTVITGRRRIGKTSLVLKAYEQSEMLYFFVGRKSEKILCEEFRRETEDKLRVKLGGNPLGFAELFEFLIDYSKNKSFTLFIDEFQNFEKINPSIFGDIQKIWDLNHRESKINLVVCGSVYSMMTKLFRDYKEPLYNRQTKYLHIKPFSPSVLKEIISDYNPNYTNDDLLALYSFTGGVAKYVELLANDTELTIHSMMESILSDDSTFIGEGKNLLIEEFGKDYDTYFSILSAIASGQTRRNEIETTVGKPVGGYLTRLEDDYNIIKREIPIGAKSSTKNSIYSISDNFLTFWFRFIFKYDGMIEIGAYRHLIHILERDYPTFSGKMLERYFYAKAVESGDYTQVGQWWDNKGENEIDLITSNMIEKTVAFYEIKRHRKNASFASLEQKASIMLSKTHCFNGYQYQCRVLDLEDM